MDESRLNREIPLTTSNMMRLLEELTPLNRVLCSSDLDWTLDVLSQELPFERRVFRADPPHNGWVIPPKWDVLEASISHRGEVIYDGSVHALGVIALSAPFEGTVSREELRKHLHYDHRYDDSLTFHFRQLFRSWDRDWGFCVTKRFYDQLSEGNYEVRIRTEESEGYLAVLEHTLHGELSDTVVVCATTDHPGVSNDGLSGVVVAIELFRWLASAPRKLTYRLVLPPSIMGTEYYLARLADQDKAQIMEALCLFMTGSQTQLALQRSRNRRSILEVLLEEELGGADVPHRAGGFEEININDEYIWEAHGIPTCSLARFPYDEYHSSRDNVSAIDPAHLQQTLDLCKAVFQELDSLTMVEKCFSGTICMSNPEIDLYVDPGQVSFGERVSTTTRKLRRLMDRLPTMDRTISTRQIARDLDLDIKFVEEYLTRCAAKGLVRLR